MARYIFSSKGLTTDIGKTLISGILKEDGNLDDKKIALFYAPYFHIRNQLEETCIRTLGFRKENIYHSYEMKFDVAEDVQYIYVSEGNTFDVMREIRNIGAEEYIRRICGMDQATYIGVSAGALLSGLSLEPALCYDRNHDNMTDFTGLKLHSSLILPHYNKRNRVQFIKNSPGIRDIYKHIHSVSELGILVLNDDQLK